MDAVGALVFHPRGMETGRAVLAAPEMLLFFPKQRGELVFPPSPCHLRGRGFQPGSQGARGLISFGDPGGHRSLTPMPEGGEVGAKEQRGPAANDKKLGALKSLNNTEMAFPVNLITAPAPAEYKRRDSITIPASAVPGEQRVTVVPPLRSRRLPALPSHAAISPPRSPGPPSSRPASGAAVGRCGRARGQERGRGWQCGVEAYWGMINKGVAERRALVGI